MKYGLTQKQLQEIQAILGAQPEIQSVWLFGSRALDTYKEASDIDLAIKGSLGSKTLMQLKDAFVDSNLPFFVDLVDYVRITEPALKKHIDAHGICIYGEGKGIYEWRECKLGDTGQVITGKTPSRDNPEDWGEEVLFITPSDYKNYGKKAYSSIRMLSQAGAARQGKRLLPENSVLVTCIGSDMGKTVVNALPCVTNQQINAIIPDRSKVDGDFIYYLTRDLYETLSTLGGDGTAVPILNKSDFENIRVTIPQLPEQKTIAAVLSSPDDKIGLLHRQNQTLEAMAATLFRQWFVEEAQEDWKAGTLGNVVDFNYGKTLKDQERSGSGYPVVGSSGVVGLHKDFLVEAPGIVTGRKGTLGVVNYFFDNFFPIDTTFYITSKIQSDGMFYEYFLVKSVGLGDMNSDSAVPGLNRNAAHAIPVTIPPSELVSSFNNFCKPTFAKINTNIRQIRTLEKLRDNLLPKLMSGEVRVTA